MVITGYNKTDYCQFEGNLAIEDTITSFLSTSVIVVVIIVYIRTITLFESLFVDFCVDALLALRYRSIASSGVRSIVTTLDTDVRVLFLRTINYYYSTLIYSAEKDAKLH